MGQRPMVMAAICLALNLPTPVLSLFRRVKACRIDPHPVHCFAGDPPHPVVHLSLTLVRVYFLFLTSVLVF